MEKLSDSIIASRESSKKAYSKKKQPERVEKIKEQNSKQKVH
jgi:hypothetical protein